jgi:hypothetical protein
MPQFGLSQSFANADVKVPVRSASGLTSTRPEGPLIWYFCTLHAVDPSGFGELWLGKYSEVL